MKKMIKEYGNCISDPDCIRGYAYEDALREVLRVRHERQKIYGDDWRAQEDWELLSHKKTKIRRLEAFIIGKSDENVYEGKKDCYVDLANYALFGLQNLLDGKAMEEFENIAIEGLEKVKRKERKARRKARKVRKAARKKVRNAKIRRGERHVERIRKANKEKKENEKNVKKREPRIRRVKSTTTTIKAQEAEDNAQAE